MRDTSWIPVALGLIGMGCIGLSGDNPVLWAIGGGLIVYAFLNSDGI